MHIIFEGVALGLMLGLVFGFGPAFFTLLQTSINNGFKQAVFFDLGVLFNDILIVIILLMTPIKIDLSEEGTAIWAGIVAGLIAIGFGIYTYLSKPCATKKRTNAAMGKVAEVEDRIQEMQKQNNIEIIKKDSLWITYFLKGFTLNIFNPFVWAFWVASVASANGGYERIRYRIMFFTAIFCTTLTIDLLKIFGATSLQRFFNEKRLIMLNKATGIILAICGIVLIIRVLL